MHRTQAQRVAGCPLCSTISPHPLHTAWSGWQSVACSSHHTVADQPHLISHTAAVSALHSLYTLYTQCGVGGSQWLAHLTIRWPTSPTSSHTPLTVPSHSRGCMCLRIKRKPSVSQAAVSALHFLYTLYTQCGVGASQWLARLTIRWPTSPTSSHTPLTVPSHSRGCMCHRIERTPSVSQAAISALHSRHTCTLHAV